MRHGLRRLDLLAMLLIVATAALFRFGRLTHESFWVDEALTTCSAMAPFSEVVHVVRQRENAPPLYFILLNRWAAVFGVSDWSLRLPSGLAGVAAVVAIYRLGWRLFPQCGHAVGLWAAAMLAVQPYHIGYSTEARPYSLVFLLTLWSCEALVALLTASRPLTQIAYVLASAAMIWTHTLAGLLLVAQNLVVLPLLLRRSRRRAAGAAAPGALDLRRWLVLQGAVISLLTPWIAASMEVWRVGAVWIGPVSLLQTLQSHSGGTPLLVAWVLMATIAAGVGIYRRSWPFWLLLSIWLVPILIPLAISALDRPMFTPRYGLGSLIGITLLCAYAAAEFRRLGQVWMMLAGGAVVAAGLWTSVPLLVQGATLLHRADIRSAAARVAQDAGSNDAVYSASVLDYSAFHRYCPRSDVTEVRSLLELSQAQPRPPHVWMLVSGGEPDPPAIDCYTIGASWSFTGVRLFRADRIRD